MCIELHYLHRHLDKYPENLEVMDKEKGFI